MSENAKSMRFNFGVAAPLKHAHHLPGAMQMANATKQGSAAPCWIKAHTFGLFRKSPGLAHAQQRENGRFRGSPGAKGPCAGGRSGRPGPPKHASLRQEMNRDRPPGACPNCNGCLACSKTKTAAFRQPWEALRLHAARKRPFHGSWKAFRPQLRGSGRLQATPGAPRRQSARKRPFSGTPRPSPADGLSTCR